MTQAINITFPPGRLVLGSLYKPQDTDADGKPLVVKQGPNAGKPRVQFFYAVAIPKGPETHWGQTAWGGQIWAVGHQSFPKEAGLPHFAWKITDGDSTVPNKKGNKPCDRVGHPGHWVLHFTSGFAPKIYMERGTKLLLEPDAVKLGYYVEVNANVNGNGSTQNAGVFLNGNLVNLAGYGEEIVLGPDASAAGFGQAPLPAGAMATPVGGFNPAPTAQMPQPPAGMPMGSVGPAAQNWPQPPAPSPVAMPPAPAAAMPPPNPAFLNVGAPPLPPQVPVAPVHAMTAKAQALGATYESFVAQGWTDALLVQHGYMAG